MKKEYLSVVFAAVLLIACSKSNTNWRDYGDYYSFKEGCYIDGEEFHFPKHKAAGKMRICPLVYDSIIDVRFQSSSWSATPDFDKEDCVRFLDFQVIIDSLSYDKSSRIMIRYDNNVEICSGLIDCIVHYYYRSLSTDLWTFYDFVDGWVSFDLGEIIANDHSGQTEYHIHNISQIKFEFSFESEGATHIIKDGYCYPQDYNLVTYYGFNPIWF